MRRREPERRDDMDREDAAHREDDRRSDAEYVARLANQPMVGWEREEFPEWAERDALLDAPMDEPDAPLSAWPYAGWPGARRETMSEYAVEVLRPSEDGKTDRMLFRQVIDEEAFDLPRIIAGVNGISQRRRSVKPEPKKKAREQAAG